MNKNALKTIIKGFIHYLKPIGLILLLFAFGCQMLDSSLENSYNRGILIHLTDQVAHANCALAENAQRQGYFQSNKTIYVNHEYQMVNYGIFSAWEKDQTTSINQQKWFHKWWIYLYVIGSIFVIIDSFLKRKQEYSKS